MSLANVRKHWRFLAVVLVIFVIVAAAGPIAVYGLMPLVWDFGYGFPLAMVLVFGALPLAWLFFVLWAGDKADRALLKEEGASAGSSAEVFR